MIIDGVGTLVTVLPDPKVVRYLSERTLEWRKSSKNGNCECLMRCFPIRNPCIFVLLSDLSRTEIIFFPILWLFLLFLFDFVFLLCCIQPVETWHQKSSDCHFFYLSQVNSNKKMIKEIY